MSLNYCFSWNFAQEIEKSSAGRVCRGCSTAEAHAHRPRPGGARLRLSGMCSVTSAGFASVSSLKRPNSTFPLNYPRSARPESRAFFNIPFCLGSSHPLRSLKLTPAAAPLRLRCGKNTSWGANLTSCVVIPHFPTSQLCFEKVSEVSSKVNL